LLSTGKILENYEHNKTTIDGILKNYDSKTGYSNYDNYDFTVDIVKKDALIRGSEEGSRRLGIIFFWNPSEVGNLLYEIEVGILPDNFFIERNISQTIKVEKSSMTDNRDNKIYNTVKIGSQTWFAENVAFKTNNGCWAYKNDQNNVSKFGYLYNWETAKNVCPDGWHLPKDNEWEILIKYFDGNELEGGVFLLAGGSLKSESYEWNSPNEGATNESGFSVLPGGVYKKDENAFKGNGIVALLWSNTPTSNSKANSYFIINENAGILKGEKSIENGYSVRCVKNK